jgi:hemoglobin
MRARSFVIAALAALSLAACGGKSSSSSTTTGTTAGAQKPLYDRLGGKAAVDAVVEDFIGNVAADARINAQFANADIPHLKQMLKDQICMATGGGCQYTGKDMKTAHQGMPIKDADFAALVEDLKKSLDKFKVGTQEQNELLTALGGMKPDIVTAK